MSSHSLYPGLVCFLNNNFKEHCPGTNLQLTRYLVSIILKMILLIIHFVKLLKFKNSTYFLHSDREHLLLCWGFNTRWWTRTSATGQNEYGWKAMLKSITGTAGTPWSCQEMEWSRCCFGEPLTWRPGPISMSLLVLTHGWVVWSPVTSALLEKVLITITGHQGAARLHWHSIQCKTHT